MPDFDQFNDEWASLPLGKEGSRTRATITPAAFAALPAKWLPCGFYTLTLTDGSQKRFRVRLERGTFMTGQRTLSRYCKIESDDDKEREWETVATVGTAGFQMFKRWRGTWEERWAMAIWLLLSPECEPPPGYKVDVEPRCWMTMRELKDEESREAGLLKKWRKEFGIG